LGRGLQGKDGPVFNNNLFDSSGVNIPYLRMGRHVVLEIAEIDGTTVVTLVKRFDVDSAPMIEKELEPVIAEHPGRVLFDFSETDYISSAGVRVLLKLTRAITDGGGTVALASLNRNVDYVFDITGFSKIFTIYPSRDKALKQMKKG
jgi:anti-sigma B factor antagonist